MDGWRCEMQIKTRSELPWLYYPESNSVRIINAHNFDSPFSPAVNGKMPIAAWIPSRDDAGNGTTTLNDLVGSNHGTLTNMDAATDWVADTAAGGVRWLDFDYSNDFVQLSQTLPISTGSFSFSLWMQTSLATQTAFITMFSNRQSGGNFNGILLTTNFNSPFQRFRTQLNTTSGVTQRQDESISALANGTVHHLVVVVNRSTNRQQTYVNGVLEYDSAKTLVGSIASTALPRIGGDPAFTSLGGYMQGRLDDIRIFNQALDANDVAALYAAQRGGQA